MIVSREYFFFELQTKLHSFIFFVSKSIFRSLVPKIVVRISITNEPISVPIIHSASPLYVPQIYPAPISSGSAGMIFITVCSALISTNTSSPKLPNDDKYVLNCDLSLMISASSLPMVHFNTINNTRYIIGIDISSIFLSTERFENFCNTLCNNIFAFSSIFFIKFV